MSLLCFKVSSGVFQSQPCHVKRNHTSIVAERITGGLERQRGERGSPGDTSRAATRGRKWAHGNLESREMGPPRPWEQGGFWGWSTPAIWEGTQRAGTQTLWGQGTALPVWCRVSVGNDERGSGSVEQRQYRPQGTQMRTPGNTEGREHLPLPSISPGVFRWQKPFGRTQTQFVHFHPSTREQIIER